MSAHTNGRMNGHLRAVLEGACEQGYNAGELTVLAPQHDPFRADTPAKHRDGEWLAVEAEQLGLGDRVIHLRGLHYMLVSGEAVKPDGKPYSNTEDDWRWLQEHAAKAARWLGYLPFAQIADHRNAPPIVQEFKPPDPTPYINVEVEIEIPDELEPRAEVADFRGVQPFKLAMFGEKASLEEILAPICERRQADLYLPTGEISDTLLYRMAAVGAADGRRMVVLCFSDSDPSGWQMPISIARKLQAFAALEFHGLEFEVHRVALSPDQVREYGLPSTPLKATELRADAWQAAMGTEQTEIDALAALQPDLLREIANKAVLPFFDTSLERRVLEARRAWLIEAQSRLEEQTDSEEMARLQSEAESKLAELREQIDALNEAMYLEVGDIELPEIEIPDPVIDVAPNGLPLIDSDEDWATQTFGLIDSKRYR
jgi:hypothetical protein